MSDLKPNPPHVLLICSDHHRFDYAGFAGHEGVKTPNLDALSQRGVVFDQCITSAPICVPARCALASGRHPCRLNATDNTACLPYDVPTLYTQLRNFGFWTAFTGKLHLGGDRKPLSPLGIPEPRLDGRRIRNFAWGFCDQFETSIEMMPVPDAHHPYTQHLLKLGLFEQYREDRRARRVARDRQDLYGEHADFCFDFDLRTDSFVVDHFLQWLDRRDPEYRFFHQVNLINPHDPYDPSPQFAARCRQAPMLDAVPLADGKPKRVFDRSLRHEPDAVRFARRQFCAMIEEIDEMVGRIIESLERHGILDETIILYTSDHGDMLGDMGLWAKTYAYEPSIHVPLIMAGPGIPQGRRSDALIEWPDIHPTICDLLSVPLLPDIDAKSFAPVLRGKTDEHREDQLIAQPHFLCLRTTRHKFVHNFNDLDELYDLAEDPTERYNILPTADPALTCDLRRRLQQRVAELDPVNRALT